MQEARNYRYEYASCTGRKKDPRDPLRRRQAYPDGTDDLGRYIIDAKTGKWKWSAGDQNNLREICCMGLVDNSLMQFPNIDWNGYDVVGGTYNVETWCVPSNPGPGDLVIWENLAIPGEGHVEFVYTTPIIGPDGVVRFETFGAQSPKIGIDSRKRAKGAGGNLKFITFLRPKVRETIEYDCGNPDPIKPKYTVSQIL